MTVDTRDTRDTNALTIRPIQPEEFADFERAISLGFGEQELPAADLQVYQAYHNLPRSLAVFEDGRIVATAGAFAMDLTLPGGARVPTSAVTVVTVRPTHRRRGLLTAMMRRQLDDVRNLGEMMAVLNASESRIYGRFGYGIATQYTNREIETPYAALRERPSGAVHLRIVPHAEALPLLEQIYARWAPTQPGALTRPSEFWPGYLIHPEGNDSHGARTYVIASTSAGEPVGYAWYRVEHRWEHGMALSTLDVGELVALSTEARAALWDFCLRMDLTRTVRLARRPVEDPLRWTLTDPRRMRTVNTRDDLWVRLLDIPGALAARGYSAQGTLTLDVTDTFIPENAGRYRLEVDASGAHCERVRSMTGTADLALDVADLGGLYLGGMRATVLAAAGRVRGEPEALTRADTLLWSPIEPYCGTPF